jgi:hypothetical protein
MASKPEKKCPSMSEPAIYRITVGGRLNAKWAERIEGMNITEASGPDGKPTAVLVGRLANQAALAGVLNTLYELHLPVRSMDCLES